MTAPDRGATYQIALASMGSSTHDNLVSEPEAIRMSQQTDLLREIAAAMSSGAPDRISDWFTEDLRRHEVRPIPAR